MRRDVSLALRIGLPVAFGLAVLILWELAVGAFRIPPAILPASPSVYPAASPAGVGSEVWCGAGGGGYVGTVIKVVGTERYGVGAVEHVVEKTMS